MICVRIAVFTAITGVAAIAPLYSQESISNGNHAAAKQIDELLESIHSLLTVSMDTLTKCQIETQKSIEKVIGDKENERNISDSVSPPAGLQQRFRIAFRVSEDARKVQRRCGADGA